MKASPFSFLLQTTLLLAVAISTAAQTGQYTVQVDSMTAQDAAESKVQSLKAQGQNAYWLKSTVPGQGVRYRVRIGRFPSRAAAMSYGARLKQQGVASDFFAALWEGASSPLNSAAPAPKPAPPPALGAAPKTAPAETKATEKAVENMPAPSTAQRQRETKPAVASPAQMPAQIEAATPANSTTAKPISNPPAVTPKPVPAAPVMTPSTPAPNNAPTTRPLPAAPTESKPLQSKPLSPPDEIKPPREKKAENAPDSNMPTPNAAASTMAAAKSETTMGKAIVSAPTVNPMVNAAVPPAPLPAAFQRFEERAYGYSFEHPGHWNGGRLNTEELQAQRIDAGAVFRSQEDVAFMNAIWNSLKNANSPSYDNNLIVDLVIKSLSSGTGLQGLSEVSRRMVQEGDQVKTFVDLRTLFRQPRANTPLEFQGKAVIIRANTGILLVVAFYSKESAPAMANAAERIISSARVP